MSLTDTDGLSIADTADLTFIGSLDAVNNGLAGLVYRGNTDFHGEDEIVIVVSDLGNTGAGGVLTDSQTISLIITKEIVSGVAPIIDGELANDTGDSNSDQLTLDPTITGQIVTNAPIVSLEANLNGNGFVDISSGLAADNSFTVAIAEYEALTATLPDGNYSIDLRATDSNGLVSNIYTVEFTLDRSSPPITLELAPESNTGDQADNITTERTVILSGQTEPGLTVVLYDFTVEVSDGRFRGYKRIADFNRH